jgi:hypothetical protein
VKPRFLCDQDGDGDRSIFECCKLLEGDDLTKGGMSVIRSYLITKVENDNNLVLIFPLFGVPNNYQRLLESWV